MPSLTIEGLILKRSNFGEADRVLTVLTKNLGKISVIARGVRKITSRRAGNIELLNIVKIGLFKGKGYTLTEAESIQTFPRIKSNLAISTAAFHILELANRFLPENQPNSRVYDLIVETLKKLEKNPRKLILRAFEVKFLSLLGFTNFQLDNPGLSSRFQPACRQGRPGDVNRTESVSTKLHPRGVPENIRKILARLENASFDEIEEMELQKDEAVALERILRYYLESVLEGKLKSVNIMNQLKK